MTRNTCGARFGATARPRYRSGGSPELDHRESVAVLRDDEEQGAPPLLGVDLNRRTVVLRPNPPKDE
ncbi:DUF6191 domain-containing protein [Nocardia brasiliensis]|uniref:Uncharacterized protein n=1 Tax=Nocardia brasiliensis (strain ATCC 700358 / HUJEG-1) TaxID=1133849 RepID=K0EL38_NOCB7|nr:DUF6191 domain-containing protein [Nocardia brasiliensis]AFT98186.1 hypothetical protein O3I_001120 [Nocardia brasiliensis ATCC 700358]OCF90854.1 hypothetical protein AW168_08415 [Nocardia brasiliensis]